MKYRFLSEEWFKAYDELAQAVEMPEALKPVLANLVVNLESGETIEARIEGGFLRPGFGEDPMATITAPEAIMYKAVVAGDVAGTMPALFNGTLKIDGSKAALVKLGMTPQTPSQKALTQQLLEITEV